MCQTRKVVKHTQTIRRLLPPDSPNCLSVFDHFAGLAFKGLKRPCYLQTTLSREPCIKLPLIVLKVVFVLLKEMQNK